MDRKKIYILNNLPKWALQNKVNKNGVSEHEKRAEGGGAEFMNGAPAGNFQLISVRELI